MPRKTNTKDCACETTGDGVDPRLGRRLFDHDAVAWLVGEGVRHMNAVEPDGEMSYFRVLELLRTSEDAVHAIGRVLSIAPADDSNLRWSLLYLLAELDQPRSLELFLKVALDKISPRPRDGQGCESARDGEVLVATMAIDGLGRLARGEAAAIDALFRIVEAQEEAALRIEAVKAILAVAPDAADRLAKMLPENLVYAIDLKVERAEALHVEFDSTAVDKVRRIPSLDRAKAAVPKSNFGPCC
jgi:hypothetical protein